MGFVRLGYVKLVLQLVVENVGCRLNFQRIGYKRSRISSTHCRHIVYLSSNINIIHSRI